MTASVARGYSSGKIIISGEHSAVYGYPAVVSLISLGVTAEVVTHSHTPTPRRFKQQILSIFAQRFTVDVSKLSLSFTGDLPIGARLGSSAASAHAAFQALATHFSKKISQPEMIELVQASEVYAHGTPSGIDTVTVVVGGVLEFERRAAGLWHQELPVKKEPTQFLLVNSGKSQENTKEMVTLVRENLSAKPSLKKVLSQMGQVTRNFIDSIKIGSPDMSLLKENQRLLEELGVVSPRTMSMIREIEQLGGVAKVSGGAGITKGSGMLLCYHQDSEKLVALCQEKKWQFYRTSILI